MRFECTTPFPLMVFNAVFDTELHADCARFVPGTNEDGLALFSCYELDERNNKRMGKLLLVERVKDTDQVNVIQSISDLSGVFELNWFSNGSPKDILVTALAEGPPKFFQYENRRLEAIEVKCEETDLEMTLAVAGDLDSFMTCDNKGFLRRWHFDNSGVLELEHCWNGHDAEIWYVSQDLRDRNLFYSGSDDYSMKIWDLRSSDSAAAAVNKSGHEAGVCCIESSPWDEFVIATGSYDEKVRLWDRRAMRAGPLQSVNCGSGAWRVRWNPKKKNEIAVAGMRTGFHVIDLNIAGGMIVQSELVDDHVAYGIDWHPNGQDLVSCSFYNNQGQFFSRK